MTGTGPGIDGALSEFLGQPVTLPCAGVYAQVLRPGRIRTGDIARLA